MPFVHLRCIQDLSKKKNVENLFDTDNFQRVSGKLLNLNCTFENNQNFYEICGLWHEH